MAAPQFKPTPAHGYNLAPGVVVESARFRRQVDIWQDPPSPIWRGAPAVEVGTARAGLWRYVVKGQGSGCATSRAAAMARGEAWANEGGYRLHYALDAVGEALERDAFAAYLADIAERFPA